MRLVETSSQRTDSTAISPFSCKPYALNSRRNGGLICSPHGALPQAGIDNSHEQLSLSEVYDCFSITERLTMEDGCVADDDRVVFDVLDGRCNPGGVPYQGVAAISILGLS